MLFLTQAFFFFLCLRITSLDGVYNNHLHVHNKAHVMLNLYFPPQCTTSARDLRLLLFPLKPVYLTPDLC